MNANKCLSCGSSNLRADRSLSGRLICNSCGSPYGVRRAGNKINNFNNFSNKKKFWIFIFIFLFSLIIVII